LQELSAILPGLEQQITAYKNRFQELVEQRQLDDELATIKMSPDLAESVYLVEADGTTSISSSSCQLSDKDFSYSHD
jgi:hypothetical protein